LIVFVVRASDHVNLEDTSEGEPSRYTSEDVDVPVVIPKLECWEPTKRGSLRSTSNQ